MIGSFLRDTLKKLPVVPGWAITIGLFAVSILYFVLKVTQLGDWPGYDFRYFWLAGEIWLHGGSPYDGTFAEQALRLAEFGHTPEIMAYPPNLWIVSGPLALTSISNAHVIWLLLSCVLLVASSFLVVSAFWSEPRDRRGYFAAVALHLFFVALFQATAIGLSSGQMSALLYFGMALLLFALRANLTFLAVAGLAILFLKPQVGAIVAGVMLVSGVPGTFRLLF